VKKRWSKEYSSFQPWTRRSTGWPCCSEEMDALQWLAVVSYGSRLSADKLNIYMHETCDWLSVCESIHLVQSTGDDQVVPVRALVQLLQAVIASSCCRTISGLTKVLVRLAMTYYTLGHVL